MNPRGLEQPFPLRAAGRSRVVAFELKRVQVRQVERMVPLDVSIHPTVVLELGLLVAWPPQFR